MGDVWVRDADDRSVSDLLKYVEGYLNARDGETSGISKKCTDMSEWDDDVEVLANDGRFEKTFIGMGSNSLVWYLRDNVVDREYALKSSVGGSVLLDGSILRDLRDVREVIDVYAYSDDFVITDYVSGEMVADYEEYELDDRRYVERMHAIIESIYSEGYLALDLHGDNVKLVDGEIVIIDVGNFARRDGSEFSLMNVIDDFEKSRRLC